jgi:hypothetical protein
VPYSEGPYPEGPYPEGVCCSEPLGAALRLRRPPPGSGTTPSGPPAVDMPDLSSDSEPLGAGPLRLCRPTAPIQLLSQSFSSSRKARATVSGYSIMATCPASGRDSNRESRKAAAALRAIR